MTVVKVTKRHEPFMQVIEPQAVETRGPSMGHMGRMGRLVSRVYH